MYAPTNVYSNQCILQPVYTPSNVYLSHSCAKLLHVPGKANQITNALRCGAFVRLTRCRCQFHWWSYDAPYYLDALNHLQDMKAEGKIRHVGLTNFDTKHLQYVTDKGVQIASNQV